MIGMNWLETVFQRYTGPKAGMRRRLLIVDGHSSHVNMRFINRCDELHILLLILPPHSTHRLQPLDVSLFAPLAIYYTNGLNSLLNKSLGMINITKRTFWSVFWPAWRQAFTTNNITSGFAKTGIWPYNPSIVLDVIMKKPPSTLMESSQILKTPLTCRAVRRIHRVYIFEPQTLLMSKILHANERLAAEHAIDQHVISGLLEAFKYEKKRRQKGKRLNLLGQEESGPQFFSPSRVQAAREYQALKDENEILHRQGIEERKAEKAAKKKQKEEEKTRKAAAFAEKKRIALETKAMKAAERQAQLELREAAKGEKKEQLQLQKKSTMQFKVQKRQKKEVRRPTTMEKTVDVEKVVLHSSKGRQLQRNKRYCD